MVKASKKKPHTQGVGAELAGIPSEFISLLIEDGDEKEWMLEELVNEGPEHKQVFSALLLTRMGKLVTEIEAVTGSKFSLQPGVEIVNAKDGTILPVLFPATAVEKDNLDAVAETVSKSPNHELVAFTSLLQAIEWAITALYKK